MKITPELIDRLMEAMCLVFALPAHVTSVVEVGHLRDQWYSTLEEYEEEDIRAAWKRLRATFTHFPFPAEFIAVLHKHIEEKDAAKPAAQ